MSISVNSILYTLPRILHLMYNKSKQALTPKVYSKLQCGISKRNQNVTLLRQTAALQSTCVHRSVKLCCDFLVLLLFENFCGIPCRLIILPVFFSLLLCCKFLYIYLNNPFFSLGNSRSGMEEMQCWWGMESSTRSH